MNNGCICWVIALPSEAKTLIEEFKMFPIQGDTLFPVYKNKNAIYDLGKWNDYEQQNPDIFFGMYQFWCQKV